MIARIRNKALERLNRSKRGRKVSARYLAAYFRRRGANDDIITEAVDGSKKRSAKRTAEMMMWAGAVNGLNRFPEYFPATTYIKSPEGKEASAEALEHYFEREPDAPAELKRFYYTFRPENDMAQARVFVREDLERRLLERATRKPSRGKIDRFTQISVLRDVVTTLSAASINTFLVSGTLLGFVRDGEIMEHDYDIDLGTMPGEVTAEDIVGAMEAVEWFTVESQDYKVVLTHSSGFAVDVFIHYERDGLFWHGTDIHEWWNTPFTLVPAEMHGVDVQVPANHELYLEENYGLWKDPVAFYNFSFDTPNREYKHESTAMIFLYRTCLKAIKSGNRWLAESSARELRDGFDVDVTKYLQRSGILEPRTSIFTADELAAARSSSN